MHKLGFYSQQMSYTTLTVPSYKKNDDQSFDKKIQKELGAS